MTANVWLNLSALAKYSGFVIQYLSFSSWHPMFASMLRMATSIFSISLKRSMRSFYQSGKASVPVQKLFPLSAPNHTLGSYKKDKYRQTTDGSQCSSDNFQLSDHRPWAYRVSLISWQSARGKNMVWWNSFSYRYNKKTTRRFEHCEEAWQVLMLQR